MQRRAGQRGGSQLCKEGAEGEGHTDETFVCVDGGGEVGDGDAPAHGDVVVGFAFHEDVGDRDVGYLEEVSIGLAYCQNRKESGGPTDRDEFRFRKIDGRQCLGCHLLRCPTKFSSHFILGGLAQVARLDCGRELPGAFQQRFGSLDNIELVRGRWRRHRDLGTASAFQKW